MIVHVQLKLSQCDFNISLPKAFLEQSQVEFTFFHRSECDKLPWQGPMWRKRAFHSKFMPVPPCFTYMHWAVVPEKVFCNLHVLLQYISFWKWWQLNFYKFNLIWVLYSIWDEFYIQYEMSFIFNLIWVWSRVDLLLSSTFNDISVIYKTAQRCADGLKKR